MDLDISKEFGFGVYIYYSKDDFAMVEGSQKAFADALK